MHVTLNTSLGNIKLALNEEKAPKTVANFRRYAESGHYEGTVFHRVIDGFMVQGGGFDANIIQKKTQGSVENEANNGLSNLTGTVAMARTSDPHSATCQFFINVSDNLFLDYKNDSPQGWGYCVFGEVVDGMDVVEKIKALPTGRLAGMQDVPRELVTIDSVAIED